MALAPALSNSIPAVKPTSPRSLAIMTGVVMTGSLPPLPMPVRLLVRLDRAVGARGRSRRAEGKMARRLVAAVARLGQQLRIRALAQLLGDRAPGAESAADGDAQRARHVAGHGRAAFGLFRRVGGEH